MRKGFSKFISLLLAVAVFMTLLPAAALAAGTAVGTQAELEAAITAGGTVALSSDIALEGPLSIPSGSDVTLDLGEYDLTYTSAVAGEDMITNAGKLTINGTTGSIVYTNTDTTASNVTVSTISNLAGAELTLNGGTVKNASSDAKAWQSNGIFPFAIDSMGASSVTVNGGAVESNYRSVRIFANSTAKVYTLTITGGTFVGQIWVQSPNANKNLADVNISGGTFSPVGRDGSSVFINNETNAVFTVNITGGKFATKVGSTNPNLLAGVIKGGSFSEKAATGTNAALFAAGARFGQTDEDGYSALEPAAFSKAAIAGTGYSSLAEAVAAAKPGDTVKLLTNVEEASIIVLDKPITLDGAGRRLTSTATRAINVNCEGKVTIRDLTIANKDTTCANAYTERAINLIQKPAELTLDNVTAEGFKYTINVAASAVGSTICVEGGKFGGYAAVNIVGDNTTFTAKNAEFTGVNDASAHVSNSFAAISIGDFTFSETTDNVSVTVTGGKISATSANGNAQCILQVSNSTGAKASIDAQLELCDGKVFSGDTAYVSATFPADYADELGAQGYDAVIEKSGTVAVYSTLAEAVAAAQAGETVKLVSNVEMEEGITIGKDQKLTVDLNGFNITGTPKEAKAFAVFTNKGELTIVGEGTILCDHKLAGSTSYAVNTITNLGVLYLNGGIIKNVSTASSQIGYAIDNNSTSANAKVTVDGAQISASGSNYYDGIRQFCNSVTAENVVEVKSGSVSSIWLQNPSDGSQGRNTKDVKGSVSVSGGSVGALYVEPSSAFAASVTGGEIGSVSAFEEAEGRDLSGFVSGGTFEKEVPAAYLAEDHVCELQEDGTYKVVPFVPQVTGLSGKSVNYKSIKLTWDAAEGADGYVIYRATSKTGSYKAIKTIEDGAETEFIRTGLTTGSACYYKVVAYKLIDGEKIYGEASAVVSAKALPEKVTGVKADSAGYSSAKITWKKVEGADGYTVYRSTTKSGGYKAVEILTGGDTLSFKDTGLTCNKPYYYKVKAYTLVSGKRVYGTASSYDGARPLPATPSGLKVSKVSSGKLKLTWSKVSGASGYVIYRSTTKSGGYKAVKTITSGSTVSFTNTGLTKGKTYYYKVKAYRTVSGSKVYGSSCSAKYAKA
ncbi:MAG: fibronectin type III domain-containing protein [Christensenellaceae bacterium]|nr:fibronectin type III domain-containing protein [Christensenellaceae bacterium]